MAHRDYAITRPQILLEMVEHRVDLTRSSTPPNHMTAERARASANPRSTNESTAHYMARIVSALPAMRGDVA